MKSLSKIIVSVILALSLIPLNGCLLKALVAPQKDQGGVAADTFENDFIAQDNGAVNAELKTIGEELFAYEVCLDSLTLNQMVTEPKDFGITPPAPTLGNYTLESIKKDNDFYRHLKARLEAIDVKTLSKSDTLTSEVISTVLDQTLALEDFFYYTEPLVPDMGIQSQLPSSLLEYKFKNTQDIKDYIALLNDVPRYFKQLEDFQVEKSKMGLLMNQNCIDKDIEAINDLLIPVEENVLVTAFNNKLDSSEDAFATLSAAEKAEFKEQNLKAVRDSVYPAYNSLRKKLGELRPLTSPDTTVASYKDGARYYELEMKGMGFEKSPSEAAAFLDLELEKLFDTLISVPGSFMGSAQPNIKGMSSPYPAKEALEYLLAQSKADFPASKSFGFVVEKTPEELPNDTALAYYKHPAIDDPDDNRIFYYPENVTDDLAYLMTLAHEGFPGHMYQSNYYRQTSPEPIREYLSSIAYMEGYAMYAELVAVNYLGITGDEYDSQVAYDAFMYAMHARVDIGINYEAWTNMDLQNYLSQYGMEAAAYELKSKAAEMPGVYLPYGLGVLEFLKLRERVSDELGSAFDVKEYHDVILRNGPLPLGLLNEQVDAWLAQK